MQTKLLNLCFSHFCLAAFEKFSFSFLMRTGLHNIHAKHDYKIFQLANVSKFDYFRRRFFQIMEKKISHLLQVYDRLFEANLHNKYDRLQPFSNLDHQSGRQASLSLDHTNTNNTAKCLLKLPPTQWRNEEESDTNAWWREWRSDRWPQELQLSLNRTNSESSATSRLRATEKLEFNQFLPRPDVISKFAMMI